MRARAKREPAFFWQGLLILLPVAVMAAIGLRAILRDKAAVEQQARQRAVEILEQLAPELGRRVGEELADFELMGCYWFEQERERLERLQRGNVMVAGSERRPLNLRRLGEPYESRLAKWQGAYPDLRAEEVFPGRVLLGGERWLLWAPGAEQAPRPAGWLVALSEEQRRAWDALGQAQVSSTTSARLKEALKYFLELNPPAEARANAEFIQLEREPTAARTPSEPIEALWQFAERHRGVPAESGVPLSNLAMAEALRRAGAGPTLGLALDALVSESLQGQSLLWPEVLNQARALIGRLPQAKELLDRAEKLWSAQARLSRIAWAVEQRDWLHGATNLWVEAGQRRWFCVLNPSGSPTNAPPAAASSLGQTKRLTELRVYPAAALGRVFARAAHATKVAVPDYLSLTAELEGEPLALPPARAVRPGGARLLAEVHDHLTLPVMALVPNRPLPGEPPPAPTVLVRRPEEAGASPLAPTELESLPAPQFALGLWLADPGRLFAQQRQRTLLFGGLIVSSMLAAVVGLAAARRAFCRQLRLSELKSNFVSSVSHELRAPIASVRLMAESLERGKIAEGPRQQEYFHFIGQECRRLSSLIENVLDFSRIEQGRKEYEFEPTDLVALAQQTVKLMETYAAERQVKLALVMAEAERAALSTQPVVDGKAIQQALVNLIDNAMKHSPKGQAVTVGLEVRGDEGRGARGECRGASAPSGEGAGRRTEEGGGRVEDGIEPPASGLAPPALRLRLWVEDHGNGIPAEEHEKIFERFYRRGSELRRETEGVGIGLSIVRHIVEAHGGRVLVRSAVGEGSRFTMELPVRAPAQESE
ncbi:MAG: HAMP domain-containing sensor histidine kinase [Verrucomicrobiota bacterium]|jgi:signal transduction histidine kinase